MELPDSTKYRKYLEISKGFTEETAQPHRGNGSKSFTRSKIRNEQLLSLKDFYYQKG